MTHTIPGPDAVAAVYAALAFMDGEAKEYRRLRLMHKQARDHSEATIMGEVAKAYETSANLLRRALEPEITP